MSTPKSYRYVHTTNKSGIKFIDALLEDQVWDQDADGGLSMSFSFPWVQGNASFYGKSDPNKYTTTDEPNAQYHFALNTTQQNAAIAALQSWANVANLRFTEVADNANSAGDIRFGWTSAANANKAWGWTYSPSEIPAAGDVWISSNSSAYTSNDWAKGSYNYMSLMHEVGHALGLKHPFEDGVILDSNVDTSRYTVMSYTGYANDLFRTISYDQQGKPSFNFYDINPETPMILDILTMQYLYGANTSYHRGDDVYTFDPNQPFMKTIWDAGGNDTISVANFTEPCTISLVDGTYSDIRIVSAPLPAGYTGGTTPTYEGKMNLGIAFDAYIENAIGGAGADTLIGNDLNNTLTGNAGNDWLDGGAGLDTANYAGLRSAYQISNLGSQFSVNDKSGHDGVDRLTNVERLHFSDINVALDYQGIAGQAFRLYQAAFDRKPDLPGLGYWLAQMDKGASLSNVAASFLASAEFQRLVGSNPSNTQLIDSFYKNVLHRLPDQAGYDYWLGQLSNKQITPAGILASFAESTENQAQVIASIQNGIDYQVWL